jgi:hypothetical protein
LSKDRNEDWDPRAIKVVIDTVRRFQKKKKSRSRTERAAGKKRAAQLKGQMERKQTTALAREMNKAVGTEERDGKARVPSERSGPGKIVTKDDTLRRHVSRNLNRARSRR